MMTTSLAVRRPAKRRMRGRLLMEVELLYVSSVRESLQLIIILWLVPIDSSKGIMIR